MGKITLKQKGIINKFSCERLSSNPENKDLIKGFTNKRNKSLAVYLKELAWDDDISNKAAVYVIKDKNNNIVMYFSLKCGILFDIPYKEYIEQKIKESKKLYKTPGVTNQTLHKSYIEIKNSFARFKLDNEREQNKQIIRVDNTYSGIELAHFCVNDNLKEQWKYCVMGHHTMGEVMFWKYIAPIIYNTQNYIGCQYVYLFAADNTKDGKLITYYNVSLKFEQPEDISTIKPSYDFKCTFMCQEINNLKKHRQDYFNNFNPDKYDITV